MKPAAAQVKGVFDKAGSKVALALPCTQKGNQQVLGRFDRGHHLVFGAINIDTAQVLLVVHPVTAMLLHQTTGIACVASVFEVNLPDVYRSLESRFPEAHIVLGLEPVSPKVVESECDSSESFLGENSRKPSKKFMASVAKDNAYSLEFAVKHDVHVLTPQVGRFAEWLAESGADAIKNSVMTAFDGLMDVNNSSTIADELKTLLVGVVEDDVTVKTAPPVQSAIAPQHGAALAHTLYSTIKAGVVMDDAMAVLVTLWILHTHLYADVPVTPYVCISSPTRRCGKTTILTLFNRLTARPLMSVNLTAAALFRKIESESPTILIDELDQMENLQTLLGILNSGYKKGGLVYRATPDKNGRDSFRVYCPKAFGLIGDLPGTLDDRCIPVHLKRKSPEQKVKSFREDHQLDELWFLQSRMLRWLADSRINIAAHAQRLFDENTNYGLHSDRAREILVPLMAIAEEIGQGWMNLAQDAAKELFNQEDESDIYERLILSIKAYFDEQEEEGRPDFVSTCILLNYLNSDDHEPWQTFNRGRPLNARQLAQILRQFKIEPFQLPRRRQEKTVKGYARSAFDDVFSRYAIDK